MLRWEVAAPDNREGREAALELPAERRGMIQLRSRHAGDAEILDPVLPNYSIERRERIRLEISVYDAKLMPVLQDRLRKELTALPEPVKDIRSPGPYPVEFTGLSI
jgi:hypothetical protein